jgi:alpha-1,2-mannosyltransferase
MMPMESSPSHRQRPRGVARRLSALLTPRRMAVWGTGLLILGWGLHLYVMAVPGYIDRDGRFKGTDYIQFYVMGSLFNEGRTDALYDGSAHLAEGRRRITPDLRLYAQYANYGPQVALAFSPLALLRFEWSLAIFLTLTAIAYAVSVWLVWRECAALQVHGRLVALLASASPLFVTVVRYAQLSAVSLLILSVALVARRRRRDFAAGLAIGCLAFKPQLGIVVAIVLLAARQWRVVAGSAVAAVAQLGIGWLVGGTAAMAAYFKVLWTLLLNPSLVQLHPSEIHSLRGFFQLLLPWPSVVTLCSIIGLIAALVVAVRSWSSSSPLTVRWGLLVLLTVLASPHLIAYDLVLLTVPLLVFADWCVRHADHPLQPRVALLLALIYLAPFSGNFARLTHVQLSVVIMVMLAWCVYRSLIPAGESRSRGFSTS